ncbi:hypothetical protein HLI_07040 [Halobacillus litoralis]|uniref:Uncharacterized protein n=1 Tax=Halobacillus litoralis TaxID=45668 RepID=A0A410MB70_9BACI|nr:hypothetical protein HLI_07040 [Halobacillus litoralis]
MSHRNKEAELNDKTVLPGLSLMHNSESCSSSIASSMLPERRMYLLLHKENPNDLFGFSSGEILLSQPRFIKR